LPSGEYATERTQSECPVSVHSCSWPNLARQHQYTQQQMIQPSKNTALTSLPVATSQTLTVRSLDPLTTCLPSGEYATELTSSECPFSVHFCSWPNPARQHKCMQQQMIHQVKPQHAPPPHFAHPISSRYCHATR
jgi:hypothetical protein